MLRVYTQFHQITLYDLQQKKVLGELTISGVRYAIWSQTKNPQVALLSKDSTRTCVFSSYFSAVVIASKTLEQLSSVHEIIRVKSGSWDENGVFIYSTLSHLKYVLPNG